VGGQRPARRPLKADDLSRSLREGIARLFGTSSLIWLFAAAAEESQAPEP
jgi:hypothetical protein